MAEPVVRIDDLVFRWPAAGSPCLNIPHFEIEAGERVFLHGPSGSGKSTLLGLLGGVLAAEQGRLRLLGSDLTQLRPTARDRFRADHVGFLFQQFNLIPYLSMIDNVLLPCRFSARRRERASAAGRSPHGEAIRLLSHLDLDPSLHRRPVTQLSVGQLDITPAGADLAVLGGCPSGRCRRAQGRLQGGGPALPAEARRLAGIGL